MSPSAGSVWQNETLLIKCYILVRKLSRGGVQRCSAARGGDASRGSPASVLPEEEAAAGEGGSCGDLGPVSFLRFQVVGVAHRISHTSLTT